MVGELTERRQFILKLVVQEFIEKALPIASETLVRKHELPVSSATVRNELAVLEELGYLTQLHTSAGRIPTDAGYRFFVEHLMDSMPLSLEEQRSIRHQLYDVRGDVEQWIQLAASLLARQVKTASVVTPPRAYESIFKHLELIAISDTVVLLVLVLHGGNVKQQLITIEHALEQQDLHQISSRISNRCADLSKAGIQECLDQSRQHPSGGEFDAFEQQILAMVIQSMTRFEYTINQQIHSDGLLDMLSQPEFIPTLMKEEDTNRAIERMRQMLDILKNSNALGTLLVQALTNDDVQVIIGQEHDNADMRNYSVVLARYGVDGRAAGVLGVIGPTRMSYPRSISTVRYVSFVMSDLLTELYGHESS